MQFHRQCKNRTARYRSTNYSVSCSAILGQQRKFSEFMGYLSPWYRVFTNAIFILKGCYGFASMQSLYYMVATIVDSPKMQFPSQCKNPTDRYVSTNYPVSCSAVSGHQWKFSEFLGYLSPWYRVCTNAIFILNGSYGCEEPKNAIS